MPQGLVLATFLLSAPLGAVEVVGELKLEADTTIDVAAGMVKRIEYLSGTAAATLTKTGSGTLELAIVGNTNATIRVEAGTLKGGALPEMRKLDGAFCRIDASLETPLEIETVNGTNFVSSIGDADGGTVYMSQHVSQPRPYLRTDGLNGRQVLDFGTYSRGPHRGHGAAMTISEKVIVKEMFYIWRDYEGTKDLVRDAGAFLGPNPVDLRFSYRGRGGNGESFAMFSDAASSVSGNIRLDGVKVGKEFVPVDGWHLVNWHGPFTNATKPSDYGFYGLGSCARSSTGSDADTAAGYGGVVIAEVVAYTNELNAADREYVDTYLEQKWFGRKARKIVALSGATLDTSVGAIRCATLDAREGTVFVGDQLRFDDGFCALPKRTVTGAYSVTDKEVSLTPDLMFAGDAEVIVAEGTGLVDRVASANGVLRKLGNGSLNLAFPDKAVGELEVRAGKLVVDPLATPGSYVHLDATRLDTMTFSNFNGTSLVIAWRDVNGNGRFLGRSSESHAYGNKNRKNYPFLATDFTNGFPVVDFGTFNDFGHQDGWGAEMDLNPKMAKAPGMETYDADNPPVWNVLAVWGDREEAKDLPLVANGKFLGPCLLGNIGAWHRGYGGGGEPFSARNFGNANMGEDNYVDGAFVPNTEWMSKYKMPERLFVQNTRIPRSQVSIQQIGGNATETTPIYQDPNGGSTRGVCGGLRLGELLVFRQELPADERFRLDRALGAKWFGRANVCEYGRVTVSEAAVLAHPHADVVATNLTVAGCLEARTVAARNLTIAAGEIKAPLALVSGGSLTVTVADGSIPALRAESAVFGKEGVIYGTYPAVNYPVKVISTASPAAAGKIRGWRGVEATSGLLLVLVRMEDGVYLDRAPGMKVILR